MRWARATRRLERQLQRTGFVCVAGVDEVGRGALAGPVVAAAVVLDPERHVPGLRDSKLLSPAQRERRCELILGRALAWAVAEASVEEVDHLNVYQASLAAMRRAVRALALSPDMVLVDAVRIPDLPVPQRSLVHGDARVASIAAASIVAKVARDRLMRDLHRQDKRYGFDRHKGYATSDHLEALACHGYSSMHRRTFRSRRLLEPPAARSRNRQ